MTDTQITQPPAPLWPARLLIVFAILACLFPLCVAEFSWWDDQLTIHQNPRITNPTLASLGYYWMEPTLGLYVPVTYTVWAIIAKMAYVPNPVDDPIFLNSWFFHTANVLVHLFSSLLVFGILRRLLGRLDAALIGALFFGMHPVQVETIGWISGMKDLLCWMFALSIVLLYIRRVQAIQSTGKPIWKSWELPTCCVLLALGILSKPTSMVTPAALLVIDGFLLRRQWVRAGLELVPLFLITGGGAVIARIAQYVETVKPAPIWQRPFIAGDGTLFYFTKILWPRHLCIDYSRTINSVMSSPTVYWHWIIPAALAAIALYQHKRRPILAAGLAIFFIGYAPVSGLATFQMQNISFTTDHYLYFSLMGIALIVAWLVTLVPAKAAYSVAAAVLLALGIRSFVQTRAWQNNMTLFESTIAANPNSAVARNNLAVAYMGGWIQRNDLAEPYLEEAIKLKPDFSIAYVNLAKVQFALGKHEEGKKNFSKAWLMMEKDGIGGRDRSRLALAIAVAHQESDEIDLAISWTEKAVEYDKHDADARRLLAQLKSTAATRPTTAPTTNPTLPDDSASSR